MGTLAAPLTVEAQPAGKSTPKLGYLSNSGGHSVPDNAISRLSRRPRRRTLVSTSSSAWRGPSACR